VNPDDPLGLLAPAKPRAGDPLDLLTPISKAPSKLSIARRNATKPHPEDTEEPEASYAQQALGGIAALAHDIPGAEAAQAGARSIFRRQPYAEALSDIRGAEEAAPTSVRLLNNVTGGTIAALAGPKGPWMSPLGRGGSAAVQGARLGAATGLLSAEPASFEDRLLKAGKGGAIGGTIAGVVGDVLPITARTLAAKSLGTKAVQRSAQMELADEAAYGKAMAEGKGATHPQVTAALNNPTARGYADAAREAPSLAGADDATILHETYKRLGERQRGLEAQLENPANYKAGAAREVQDIELAKRQLLAAADQIMPGYRQAVQGHAQLAGEYDAFQDASDATNRIVRKASVAGRNLLKNTPEAFKDRIAAMDRAKAEAAREAVLGRLHDKATEYVTPNPLKLFGAPKTAGAIGRAAPYLDLLDQRIKTNPNLFRDALMAALGSHAGN
jgi:hypothetical protein